MSRSFFITLTLLTVLVFAVGAASAQSPGKRIGFFGGLNFANQGGDMEDVGDELAAALEDELGGTWTAEKSANTGFGFGAYMLAQKSPTFGIQIEAQYIRRGAKVELTSTGLAVDVKETAKFQLDYLELPCLARLSPSTGGKIEPFFLVGPVIGLKVGANMAVEAESMAAGESADMSVDISDAYQSLTVGALGGAGIAASLGATSHLVVQARYYVGLTNALDDPELSTKSSDLGVFAGLEFTSK